MSPPSSNSYIASTATALALAFGLRVLVTLPLVGEPSTPSGQTAQATSEASRSTMDAGIASTLAGPRSTHMVPNEVIIAAPAAEVGEWIFDSDDLPRALVDRPAASATCWAFVCVALVAD